VEEGGSWPRRTLELWPRNMSGVRSGSGSPGTATPGHARGRQGKRAGAPTSGPARRVGLSYKERERRWEGEREVDRRDRLRVGPAGRERTLTRGPAGFK
jgi:hypothetical protein